ncbi:MAG: tryptophan 7-halogenase, partial [Symploca sp. SIO2E6]|nr:tryptophan 7-halogenase [Symploca sp. SIO2E6]
GWLSAAYISKLLDLQKNQNYSVKVVESPDIPTIGIGEATIPTIIEIFQFLDISEDKWMRKCDATFKLGTRFENWYEGKEAFWHPNARKFFQKSDHSKLIFEWLEYSFSGGTSSFESCFEAIISSCLQNKSPKLESDIQYSSKLEYAYHFDSRKFADFFQSHCLELGVTLISDTVQEVCLDENGYISHLNCAHHCITGDFFIDCTGFKGLLINQALQEPFISYSDYLLCNSAVVAADSLETNDKFNFQNREIRPYTNSKALSSGWMWNIPLVSKTSYGYVYSNHCISKEEAEKEFISELPSSVTQSPRHISMRVGRTKRPWVKNCLSVGLSSGFIEPLESTGIFIIEYALYYLRYFFPDKNHNPKISEQYNDVMRKEYEEILDFVTMHYVLSKRENSEFWKHYKFSASYPSSLSDKLERWTVRWPNSPN